jgi:hypothetical protein
MQARWPELSHVQRVAANGGDNAEFGLETIRRLVTEGLRRTWGKASHKLRVRKCGRPALDGNSTALTLA